MGLIILFLATLEKHRERGEKNLSISLSNARIPVREFVLVDKQPTGYTDAINRGWKHLLQQSDWDAICMLQDDLYFEEDNWLRRLREALFSADDIAMAGPSVKCGTHPQNKGRPGMARGAVIVKRLSFTGALIKRDVIEKVGLLDSSLMHYGSDYDFLHRAQELGWKAVWVQDVWCEHDWQSTNIYPQWAKQDRVLFYSRWTTQGQRR